jgi:micrococcal nuclease
VSEVYDGDTITCDVDCGFGVTLVKQKIRLIGINAPEVRGDERDAGVISRDALREKILNKRVTLKTLKDSKEKYGRYLATILLKEDGHVIDINKWLVENNYAAVAEY